MRPTFQAAHTAVDSGGEIIALDAAGCGSLMIEKSLTVAANPGVHAAAGNPQGLYAVITIMQPGVEATLRNLSINGGGTAHGILVGFGARVTVDNCVISETNYGIDAYNATVRVHASVIRDSLYGIFAQSSTLGIERSTIAGSQWAGLYHRALQPGTHPVTIRATTFSANHTGIQTSALFDSVAQISIAGSTIANNQRGIATETIDAIPGVAAVIVSASQVAGNAVVGLLQEGANKIESLGNNLIRHNGLDASGAITLVSGF